MKFIDLNPITGGLPPGSLWEDKNGIQQKVRIEAVATDLSPASSSAGLTHLPNAVHGFDHLPSIKLDNEGRSDLRRPRRSI